MAAPVIAPTFQGVDFYDADSLLTADEIALRERVRAWVDERLMPIISQHYLDGTFPHHLVPELLGRARVRRSGGDRKRPPLHLRLARRERSDTPRDPLGR